MDIATEELCLLEVIEGIVVILNRLERQGSPTTARALAAGLWEKARAFTLDTKLPREIGNTLLLC